jgi:hypothetical protein
MDITGLVKNPEKVKKALTILEDGSVIANRNLFIQIPRRFTQNGLAEITDFVTTAPVLGIILPDDCYCCFLSMLNMNLYPTDMTDVSINGDKYVHMEFFKGDTVFENVRSSIDPNMPYYYFMEFVNYAKIPWYMDWKVHSTLFDSALAELGKKVGASPQVMRTLFSIIYRDPDDLEKPYRGSKAMKEGRDPVIVGLNNPSMLITDSFSRYIGGYLNDNLLSSIIKPSDKVTGLDKMIRGIPTDE